MAQMMQTPTGPARSATRAGPPEHVVTRFRQSAYWPGWGGDADPSAQYRTMDMIKNLLDDLHQSEQIRAGNDERLMTELTITGVHMHHNLAIIEKGLNTEQGAPEWLRGIDHASAYADK